MLCPSNSPINCSIQPFQDGQLPTLCLLCPGQVGGRGATKGCRDLGLLFALEAGAQRKNRGGERGANERHEEKAGEETAPAATGCAMRCGEHILKYALPREKNQGG